MSHLWRDEDILRELYWDEGLSISEIADRLDCGHNTVFRWMKRLGISRRNAPQDKPVHYRTEQRGYEVWRYDNGSTQHKVRVHRLLAVAEYGFDAVVSADDVHHKSHVPWDNRPSNIELVSKEEHAALHHPQEDS